ncbi:MAG: hypothetical protein IJR89_03200 [Clostridia bacterium]|nr:hypothetical protein [Clostridia bacterium]
MKKQTKRLLCLTFGLIFLFAAGLAIVSFAAGNDNGAYPGDRYEYPITPQKTPERWREMDHGEAVLACEIPADVLPRLSTKQLLLTCFDYPHFGDCYFYFGDLIGFEVIKIHFNGLQELWEREDFSSVLAAYFEEQTDQIDRSVQPNHLSTLTRAAILDGKIAERDVQTILAASGTIAEKSETDSKEYRVFSSLVNGIQRSRGQEEPPDDPPGPPAPDGWRSSAISATRKSSTPASSRRGR